MCSWYLGGAHLCSIESGFSDLKSSFFFILNFQQALIRLVWTWDEAVLFILVEVHGVIARVESLDFMQS